MSEQNWPKYSNLFLKQKKYDMFHRENNPKTHNYRLVTLLYVSCTMPADFDTFRSVLFYCAAILALPISTFFLSKFILFDGLLQLDNIYSNVFSAISAVIMLHVNLGMFIYKACSADDTPKKPEKLE